MTKTVVRMISICNISRRWRFLMFVALIPLLLVYILVYRKVTRDVNKPIKINFQQYLHKDGFSKHHAIPKIIHQIWSDDILPDQFVDHVKSLIKYNQHPEWSYYFWTLDVGREFVRQNYPKLLNMYDSKNKITKADILRILVIYHYGGVYLDLDVVGVRPLDRFVENHECALVAPIPEFFVAYDLEIDYRAVNNAIFLCRAHHPFFKILVHETEARSKSCESNDTCSIKPAFPHPLLVDLTDAGNKEIVPEVVDYILFDGKYDPVIEKPLEQKCSKKNYSYLEPAKQRICDNWKKMGKGNRKVHENAYTFHTWYHTDARRVTADPKNKISNIVPHVKIYNSLLQGHYHDIS